MKAMRFRVISQTLLIIYTESNQDTEEHSSDSYNFILGVVVSSEDSA